MDESSETPCRPINNLKIGLLNIRSIRHKLSYVNEVLNEFSLDLFFISETWLHESETTVICASLPKIYSLLHVPRSNDPEERGGGVAVIYKNHFTNVKILSNFHSGTAFEAISVAIHISNFVLNAALIYRPGHSGTDCSFLSDFNEFLGTFSELGHNFFLCGDYNYWLDDPSKNPFATSFVNILDSHNCINSVKQPTHAAGHILDLVIHDHENDKINNIVVHPRDPHVSDHSLITFTYNHCFKQKTVIEKISFRSYKNVDINELICNVTTRFSSINVNTSTNDLVSNYNSILLSIFNTYCPTVEKTIRIQDSNPWYDSSVSLLRRERRRAERKWRSSGSEEARLVYIEARAKVVLHVEQKKIVYYNSTIDKCGSNQKKLWKVYNTLFGDGQPSHPNFDSDENVCLVINSYFIDKIKKLRGDLDDTTSSVSYSDKYLNHTFHYGVRELTHFATVSEQETQNILNSVNKTFCTSDPINFSKLPEVLPILVPSITSIINSSFLSGIFPNSEKIAIVKPLLKKPSLAKDDLKNYRPISNLSYLSKVIEKAILNQLVPHLNANGGIPKFQSAYRSHHSTETALCRIYNDLINNINNSKSTVLVLLDLSSAFDTIDHIMLIDELEMCGVKSTALALLKSYLDGRSQRVAIDHSLSEPLKLSHGVPQGSVLGPILFSLYASQLTEIMKAHGVSYHIYADDTQIYIPITDILTVNENITSLLTDIKIWMHERKLKLNEGKTDVIFINGPLKNDVSFKVYESVTNSLSVKNLGVIFDSKLNFNEHFNNLLKSCNFHLRRLSLITKYLDSDCIKTLMHAFITSRVDYCNSLFVNLPKKDLKRLQYVLNRAARLIFKLPPYVSITPYLLKLHWLPIIARIEFKVCLLAHKVLCFGSPVYIRDMLVDYTSPPNMTLRAAAEPHLLVVPRLNSHYSYSSRAFSYAAPVLYNRLPSAIRSTENIETFKKMLKTHLFLRAYNASTNSLKLEYQVH